jgi:hypothetical protein
MQWSSTYALPKQHNKIRCFEQSLFVRSKKRSQLGITSAIFSYNFLLSLTCMDKRYFLESQTFLYEFTVFTLLIYIYANLCTTKTILNCDIEWLILVFLFLKCCHGSFGISYTVGSMCIYNCCVIGWPTGDESLSIFVRCVLCSLCKY